jgi:hypothetical protein
MFKDSLKDIGVAIMFGLRFLAQLLYPRADEVKNSPVINPPEPIQPPIEIKPAPPEPYMWDTTANSRHSVRVICDEMGLTLTEKNIITACIQQESNFNNKAIGRNMKDGNLLSTDWGICQINDYWHVGPGKKWSSVAQIINNPDKAVKWMIQMYKQGQLKLWVSYSSGAYKKYL